jgi:4-diphosphocytidyl-2-C-methyl-D-erythritol kinase
VNEIAVCAPAKLNLGLEILGRRSDGYHEIATILQTVSRFDHLRLTAAPAVRLAVADDALRGEDNLVLRALNLLRRHGGVTTGAQADLVKSIPVAAGLGGASSDAASALIAGQRLWGTAFSETTLAALALELGTDVPFFLRGGTSVATGRGEVLEPLPPISPTWFVIVVPRITIERKTASLYRALTMADFSDGEIVRSLADRLRDGQPLATDRLGNAFVRPLYALHPNLRQVPITMTDAGAPFAALSGAGLSHYTAVDDEQEAARLVDHLSAAFGAAASVFTCVPVAGSVPTATTRE